MSKKLKCLSIFMAATVVTSLMGGNFAFAADKAEALENTNITVVSSDDTYTIIDKKDSQYKVINDDSFDIINKDDLVEISSKDENEANTDDIYEVSTNKPVIDDDNTGTPGPGSTENPGPGSSTTPDTGNTQAPPTIDSDNEEIDLTGENIWETDDENTGNRYVVINNLKFLLFSGSASIVKSNLECDVEDLVLPSMIKSGNKYYPVDSLSDNALENCKSLKSVVLSKHLKYLSAGAFIYNNNLETISIDPANDNLICEDNVFFNKDKSELILYFDKNNTSYTVPEGVTQIGSYAFNCPSGTCPLTEIKLPESLKELGMDTFSHSKIESITIPANLEKMGFGSFSDCNNLKNVAFAKGSKLNSLATCTFYRCNNLVNVSLPQSLEYIGNSAFKNCYKLKNVTLPQSLISIGTDSFMHCESITNISIPLNVTEVGSCAFEYCENLANVIFNCDDLSTIKYKTFYACYSLKNVKLPQNLKTIESEAFASSSSLKNLQLPASATDIADDAF